MKDKQPIILIIDDEESIRDSCSQIIIKDGLLAETAEDGSEGLQKAQEMKPEMALIDLKMPGISGMEVLDKIREIDPYIIPVVITGYASIESAVEAMKKGAYDYLPKPFSPNELRMIIRRGLERRKLLLETESLRREKRLMEENFITMVSHQLRSPLVAVQQYFEVLLAGMAGEVKEKQKNMIQRASDRLKSLLNLIDDWLDMAKINNGLIVSRFKPFSLKDLLKKLVEFMQPVAEEAGISLEFSPVSDAYVVNGDEETLEQVFTNLISNAVKYNRPEGTVRVILEENDDFIITKVEDTGLGIAEEHLPYIFDQFYRVNRKEDQKTKGTGLGLSIAKKIVEAHGGTIHADSEPGDGSTFTVLLPKVEKEDLVD